MTTSHWRVNPLHDKDPIRRFLNRDRAFGAYVLGDLDEPYWGYSEFYGAFPGHTGEPEALVLHYTGFETPLLVVLGDPEGIAAILDQMLDKRSIYYTVPEPLLPLFQHYYETPDARLMWRMVFDPEIVFPERRERALPIRGDEGVALLAHLFAGMREEEGHHFSPSQVADGAFFGIFEGEDLVSVAGTHLISDTESVAAVGNVYTRPDFRRQGYASLCTAATTHALRQRGIKTIVLNVAQDNHAAVHIYEKLGYSRHLPFWEGMGYLRSPSFASHVRQTRRRQEDNPVLK